MKKLDSMNTYWSSVPNVWNPDYVEGMKPTVVPYQESLMAADHSQAVMSWKWVNWHVDQNLYAMFDFCGEAYVDHIVLHMYIPKNADHVDYQQFLLSYRTAEDPRYRVCYRHMRTDEPDVREDEHFSITLPVKQTVRCLNLQIRRNEWWYAPVPTIEVFGEEPTSSLAPLTAEQFEEEWHNEPIICDEFGQCTYIDWPGKITCDEDLQRDAARDAERLKDVRWNSGRYDNFGGWITDKNYGATGFFRVEKIDGVWWFISPEGNLYFMKGVDDIEYEEMAHYTPLYQLNSDKVRTCFEALPDKEKYPMAYLTDGPKDVPVVAFHHANIYRKYGENYQEKWADITFKRLIDWNFNASGKWKLSSALKNKLPRVAALGRSDELIRTKSGFDPWDPEFEAKLDRYFSVKLPADKDDPYIIGYHFSNEDGWEMDDLRRILHTTDHSFPAKEAFVNFVKERYQGDLRVVNVVLNTEAASFEELITTDINMDTIPKADATEFVKESSIRFHSIMSRVFKKYDPNHLFFGCTPVLGWRSSLEWDSVYAECVDVLAFDWYFSQTADWMRPYLHLDKPMVNIELGWVTCDRGHGPFFHGMTCKTQAERAQRYTRYMRNQAKVPQFVGFGYFIYFDEVITGRNNGDGRWGECHQFGLVNEQDQPYEEFVSVVKEVNAHLEELHLKGGPQE